MSRTARVHRTLALIAAAVAALAASAPASASPARDDVNFVAKTCGGPSEIVECPPPVKSHPDTPIDDEAQPTCGGPNDVVECAPPVEAQPGRGEAIWPE